VIVSPSHTTMDDDAPQIDDSLAMEVAKDIDKVEPDQTDEDLLDRVAPLLRILTRPVVLAGPALEALNGLGPRFVEVTAEDPGHVAMPCEASVHPAEGVDLSPAVFAPKGHMDGVYLERSRGARNSRGQ